MYSINLCFKNFRCKYIYIIIIFFYLFKLKKNTCVACTSFTSSLVGAAYITSCTVSDAAATTVSDIKSCAIGYAPFKLSTGTWKGCLSCAGSTDGSSNVTPVGHVSCTAPTPTTWTAASAAASTITNLVCDDGYYVSDFGTCTAFANLDDTSTTA
jgi:hypothetical protein